MEFQGQTRLQVDCCVSTSVISTSSGVRVWCCSELGFGATGVWDLETWAALCKNNSHGTNHMLNHARNVPVEGD